MTNPEEFELLPLSDPRVLQALGVNHFRDPYQAAARIVRAGQVPAIRIGRRIRISLPALEAWVAGNLNAQAACAAAQ